MVVGQQDLLCFSAECGTSVVISLIKLVPVHSCLLDSNPGTCVFTHRQSPVWD